MTQNYRELWGKSTPLPLKQPYKGSVYFDSRDDRTSFGDAAFTTGGQQGSTSLAIKDLGENKNHIVAPGASNAPLYTILNSRPCWLVDGVDDYLNFLRSITVDTVRGGSFVYVAQPDAGATNKTIFGGPLNAFAAMTNGGNSPRLNKADTATAYTSTVAMSSASPNLIGQTYVPGATSAILLINGNVTNRTGTVTATSSFAAIDRMFQADGGNWFKGYFFAGMYVPFALTAEQMWPLLRYFNDVFKLGYM